MARTPERIPSQTTKEDLIATCTAELDKLIPADVRKTLRVKTAVRIRKPYEQIVQHAAEPQVDWVAMAVRGGDALDRTVFGSTTYRVIQLGPVPFSRFITKRDEMSLP